ncbi:VanZ family protein [Sinomicrobium pectinilyticum]|uniref:VanZ family protein n=1 Tax=Sinomicrobium pectinilyticum TaxID=1084421 RepID=UPI001F0CB407|nr:VanZ family protein [Sinomicrobium pectinilyticum]
MTVTVLSLAPPSTLPSVSYPHLDKIVHFIFYYIFLILWYYALRGEDTFGPVKKKPLLIAFFMAFVYGTIVEVLQYTMGKGRSGDILDALANTTGMICGIFTVILVNAINKTIKRVN